MGGRESKKFWTVKNGAIVGQTTKVNPTKGNTFLVWQGGEVSNFEFRCKVRFQGNNSGVQYRSRIIDAENFALEGYQADLHQKQEFFGMMYGEKTGRGIIAKRNQKLIIEKDGTKKVAGSVGNDAVLVDEEWNDLRIVAVGNRMIHQVNGVTTIDLTDHHPKSMQKGVLGLQLHAGPPMKVEFRNLLLRKLDGAEAEQVIQEAAASIAPKSGSEHSSAVKVAPKKNANWLTNKPASQWIWASKTGDGQKVWFRRTVKLNDKVKSARLYASCDNKMKLWINEKKVGESPSWGSPIEMDVTKTLKKGDNLFAVEGQNEGGIAALVLKLEINLQNGEKQIIVTDKQWKFSVESKANWNNLEFDDSKWVASKEMGALGKDPWKIPRYTNRTSDSKSSSVSVDPMNPKNIITPPGFVVDRIYSIPKEEGSWVSLTTDPKGRFYACDQRNAGLFRITVHNDKAPEIEKVSVGPLADLSGAQGLLWAFDSLWFHRNGGNIYRLTDTDGDDKLDKYEVIPSEKGGGEHGNHALILTEDGKGIYVDGGNHASIAETVRSRVTTWDEDLLLPRMWDARGHARGRMAPGGWVTRLDPKTYSQTLYATGFSKSIRHCIE